MRLAEGQPPACHETLASTLRGGFTNTYTTVVVLYVVDVGEHIARDTLQMATVHVRTNS